MLTAAQKAELEIRAGHLAKASLELTSVSSRDMAHLILVQVAKELRELDEFLKKAATHAG
jgi:hypothetical protein